MECLLKSVLNSFVAPAGGGSPGSNVGMGSGSRGEAGFCVTTGFEVRPVGSPTRGWVWEGWLVLLSFWDAVQAERNKAPTNTHRISLRVKAGLFMISLIISFE